MSCLVWYSAEPPSVSCWMTAYRAEYVDIAAYRRVIMGNNCIVYYRVIVDGKLFKNFLTVMAGSGLVRINRSSVAPSYVSCTKIICSFR